MASIRDSDVLLHEEDRGELITGEAVALQLLPTSFVLRAAGGAIDYIVYMLVNIFVVGFGLGALAGGLGADEAVRQAVSVVSGVIGLVAIPTGVEIITQGRSLGRLVVGARIVRDDGGAIGFRQAFIRSLVGLLEIFGTFGGIATLVALLNSRAKRLGDMLAGTYSQQERISGTPEPVFGVPYELSEWARTADVARMPDPLARRVEPVPAAGRRACSPPRASATPATSRTRCRCTCHRSRSARAPSCSSPPSRCSAGSASSPRCSARPAASRR